MRLSVEQGIKLFQTLEGKQLTYRTEGQFIVFYIEQAILLDRQIRHLKSKKRNRKGNK